ncbi:Vanin-like protein 2 [Pseudolycoriella hygida]|uniref:Vanin-like protein 2 n=1 Tax=Pseudolycoriella hygida TaxID=35572 RepID=A0A9Q0NHL0_9DIPT|nr:Vanin-like protein 2 [Pseudolycoriella hygida]
MSIFTFLTILSIVELSLQASTPSSPTYEAGVVEFNYERDPSITQATRTALNLAKYLEIMREAPSTLDIIVFPEMTLNQMETAVEIPDHRDRVSPCDSVDYPENNLVKQISCSAKSHQRYVVVGVVTKVACPDEEMIANNDTRDCADREDSMSYYNTNVVFDRNGTVISSYRKFNLFGEDVDRPLKPSQVVFESDFGVTFGHFICFDILFRYPALELTRSQNITDIIYPTMWFSGFPFLTAVQVQKNWAFSNNVNLLAAGANNPSFGSTGTGIFAGRKGSLISVMEGAKKTSLHTATVPKIGLGDSIEVTENVIYRPREEVSQLTLSLEFLDGYNIQFLNTESQVGETASTSLCHDGICCTFDYGFYKVNSLPTSHTFAATVFHGKRIWDGSGYGVTVCAVVACLTNDTETCAVRMDSMTFDHRWHSLKISGQFPSGEQYFYLPNTLDSSINPFMVREFVYDETFDGTSKVHISMTSVGRIREFYSFGIYGRDFNLDATGGTKGKQVCYILMACTIIAACFLEFIK